MHICSTHGCHTSHAHAGFCPDCLAVHAAGLSLSAPTLLLAVAGAALLAFSAHKLLRARSTVNVVTA